MVSWVPTWGEGVTLRHSSLGNSQVASRCNHFSLHIRLHDCIGAFIIISCYIFQLCSYDQDMILQWIWFKFKICVYFLKQKTMFRIFLGANWIFVFTNRNYIYESENAPIHPLPYGLFLPHVISPREIWSNNIFATGIWSLENSIWNKLSCFRYNIYTNFFIEKYVYLNIYEFHVAHPTGNFTIRHCNTERNK